MVAGLVSGCRSLYPISAGREKVPNRIVFDKLFPVWQPFAEGESQGLYYFTARILEPKLEIWAIKADLSDPSLKIEINDGGRSTRVSSFVRNNSLLAGINTVPFDPVSAREDEERACAGVVVSESIIKSFPVPAYDAIVFYRQQNAPEHGGGSRRADIISQGEMSDLGLVENAAGGFKIILREGELPPRLLPDARPNPGGDAPGLEVAPRHPRSAAGLSDNGRTLYLLVIDGRRKGSIGATEAETGIILKKLGAENGLNFDGGGSTALALRFPGGKVRVVNYPIHGGIPGRERAVAACLGIGTVENY